MTSEFPIFQSPAVPQVPDGLVCVVDDDEGIRECLDRLFRSARFAVRTYASAGDYLDREPHSGPVCVVLDVRMPGLDGFDLQHALSGSGEQVVFLTGHGDVAMCAKAMKSGAVDFLTKPVDDEILLAAVGLALERAHGFCAEREKQASVREMLRTLTRRETEVMLRVVDGKLNKQIAAELGIAEKTVKIHRGRAMKKTRSASVPDLMKLIQSAGGTGMFTPTPPPA